jgi:hypothetical protein
MSVIPIIPGQRRLEEISYLVEDGIAELPRILAGLVVINSILHRPTTWELAASYLNGESTCSHAVARGWARLP